MSIRKPDIQVREKTRGHTRDRGIASSPSRQPRPPLTSTEPAKIALERQARSAYANERVPSPLPPPTSRTSFDTRPASLLNEYERVFSRPPPPASRNPFDTRPAFLRNKYKRDASGDLALPADNFARRTREETTQDRPAIVERIIERPLTGTRLGEDTPELLRRRGSVDTIDHRPNAPTSLHGRNDAQVIWNISSTQDTTVHLELDIEVDLGTHLETFSRLRRLGRFREAEELYRDHLCDYKDLAYVVIEYMEMLLDQGAYKRLKEMFGELEKTPLVIETVHGSSENRQHQRNAEIFATNPNVERDKLSRAFHETKAILERELEARRQSRNRNPALGEITSEQEREREGKREREQDVFILELERGLFARERELHRFERARAVPDFKGGMVDRQGNEIYLDDDEDLPTTFNDNATRLGLCFDLIELSSKICTQSFSTGEIQAAAQDAFLQDIRLQIEHSLRTMSFQIEQNSNEAISPSVDPLNIRILGHWLEIMQWSRGMSKLVDSYRCLDRWSNWTYWRSLYENLLSEERICEFADIFRSTCSVFREDFMWQKFFSVPLRSVGSFDLFLKDWKLDEYDESSYLIALDIFTGIAQSYLERLSPDSLDEDITLSRRCLEYARRFSMCIKENDPHSVKSRPYLNWILAEEIFARKLASFEKGSVTTESVVGRFPGLYLPVILPVYIPVASENPNWHAFQPPGCKNDLLDTVLLTTRDIGDYKTETACLKELIHHTQNPAELLKQVEHIEKTVQGDTHAYTFTCLFRFLIADTSEKRKELFEELTVLGTRSRKAYEPFLDWCRLIILNALEPGTQHCEVSLFDDLPLAVRKQIRAHDSSNTLGFYLRARAGEHGSAAPAEDAANTQREAEIYREGSDYEAGERTSTAPFVKRPESGSTPNPNTTTDTMTERAQRVDEVSRRPQIPLTSQKIELKNGKDQVNSEEKDGKHTGAERKTIKEREVPRDRSRSRSTGRSRSRSQSSTEESSSDGTHVISRSHSSSSFYADPHARPSLSASPGFENNHQLVLYSEAINDSRRHFSLAVQQQPTSLTSTKEHQPNSSSQVFRDDQKLPPIKERPSKEKTKIPTRLVSKKAIIELGYPFEEKDDMIVIHKALSQDSIDEVIELSKSYKVLTSKKTATHPSKWPATEISLDAVSLEILHGYKYSYSFDAENAGVVIIQGQISRDEEQFLLDCSTACRLKKEKGLTKEAESTAYKNDTAGLANPFEARKFVTVEEHSPSPSLVDDDFGWGSFATKKDKKIKRKKAFSFEDLDRAPVIEQTPLIESMPMPDSPRHGGDDDIWNFGFAAGSKKKKKDKKGLGVAGDKDENGEEKKADDQQSTGDKGLSEHATQRTMDAGWGSGWAPPKAKKKGKEVASSDWDREDGAKRAVDNGMPDGKQNKTRLEEEPVENTTNELFGIAKSTSHSENQEEDREDLYGEAPIRPLRRRNEKAPILPLRRRNENTTEAHMSHHPDEQRDAKKSSPRTVHDDYLARVSEIDGGNPGKNANFPLPLKKTDIGTGEDGNGKGRLETVSMGSKEKAKQVKAAPPVRTSIEIEEMSDSEDMQGPVQHGANHKDDGD